jgi:Cu/Ag efflux protein CusF
MDDGSNFAHNPGRLENQTTFLVHKAVNNHKEEQMNRRMGRPVLYAVLLVSALASGLALAAEKQNAFEQEKRKDTQIDGKITAIDAAARTVTVKHDQKSKTFSVAKDAMLFVNHKKGAASLADFKAGEEVRLLYRQDGSNVVCHSLWQPGANPEEKEHRIEKQSQPK